MFLLLVPFFYDDIEPLVLALVVCGFFPFCCFCLAVVSLSSCLCVLYLLFGVVLLSGAFERLASVSVARFLIASSHLPSSVLYFLLCLVSLLVLLSSVFVPVGALRLLVFVSSFCLLCRVLMSWGDVLAGWLCCACVVHVFSLSA